MTEEERQLLLTDLCARMPSCCGGVIVQYLDRYCHKRIGRLASIWCDGGGIIIESIPVWEKDSRLWYLNDFDETHGYEKGTILDNVKPYLRPMSSMTTEEEYEYHQCKNIDYLEICEMEHTKMLETTALCFSRATDWFNKNGFDYRGLIPMGLALEAPEGMYKTE